MTLLTTILLLGFAAAESPQSTPPSEDAAAADSVDFRLAEHRWAHRLLFLFASSRDTAPYREQMTRFADAESGFRERDLLLIEVVDDGPSRLGDRPLTAAAEERLRNRFDVGPLAFRVILVGKDGTEKRRDEAPVSAQSIFDTIDAMPMRQREMREDNGGG
jgi:hypothetical protein